MSSLATTGWADRDVRIPLEMPSQPRPDPRCLRTHDGDGSRTAAAPPHLRWPRCAVLLPCHGYLFPRKRDGRHLRGRWGGPSSSRPFLTRDTRATPWSSASSDAKVIADALDSLRAIQVIMRMPCKSQQM